MKYLLIISALFATVAAYGGPRYHSEILSALKHLEHTQSLEKGVYDPGQWPTQVTAILAPGLFGVGRWGKAYPEATIFTTSTIINVLRQILATNPRYEPQIMPLILRARQGFPAYFIPPFYNFYPLRKRNGTWVRGPRNMFLAPYLRGLANIPPDSDTTSVTYLALDTIVPHQVLKTFEQFRDTDRKPHSYNKRLGIINSGAYMTWFMDENDPDMPRKIGQPELGPRIPLGTNDVDCIINTNILILLETQRKTQSAGYKDSCQYLQKIIEKNQYGVCGIYYPSDYLLPVRIAEFYRQGGRCLQNQNQKILQFLLDTQHPNGSWGNSPPNRPDRVHSTALALNALMLLGNQKNPEHRRQVRRGIQFLLKNSLKSPQGNIYWKGQVFFSAIAQARYSVVWRSSSYTTILAARALQLAEKF